MTSQTVARPVATFIALLAPAACAAAPALRSHALPGGLRSHAGAFEVSVLVHGVPAETFWHAGETYVLGRLGERYTVRVVNHSPRRVEAVVSVDGRDVIDGRTADFRGKRGYVVPAWGHVDIDGWRVSQAEAAAFRFARVADSYAERTGTARHVGVIGVAMFEERTHGRRHHGPPAPEAESDNQGSKQGMPGAAADAAEPHPHAGRGSRSEPAPQQRPGLGTEFGEPVSSPVFEVAFVRASPGQPSAVLGMRYNDREGLLAIGVNVGWPYYADEPHLRRTADPFPVSDRRYAAPPSGWHR